MNDLVQAILLLSGPIGTAAVWWFKRRDDIKLRKRVDECEQDRADLRAKVNELERADAEHCGTVNTLTELLRREINVGG